MTTTAIIATWRHNWHQGRTEALELLTTLDVPAMNVLMNLIMGLKGCERRHAGGDVRTGCEELDEHEEHEVFVAVNNLEARAVDR